MTNTNQAPETEPEVRTDEEVEQYENDLPF